MILFWMFEPLKENGSIFSWISPLTVRVWKILFSSDATLKRERAWPHLIFWIGATELAPLPFPCHAPELTEECLQDATMATKRKKHVPRLVEVHLPVKRPFTWQEKLTAKETLLIQMLGCIPRKFAVQNIHILQEEKRWPLTAEYLMSITGNHKAIHRLSSVIFLSCSLFYSIYI